MGVSQPSNLAHQYSITLPPETKLDSAILRNPKVNNGFHSSIGPGLDTMNKYIRFCFSNFSNRPMLGTRKQSSYTWKTYKEVEELCIHFGSGLIYLNLCPLENHDSYDVRFISVYSLNREEWVFADLGSLLFNISNIPIYDALSAEAISYILQQTNLKTIVISQNKIEKLFEIKVKKMAHSLENIISMDTLSSELKEKCLKIGFKIYEFSEIVEIGKTNPQPISLNTKPLDIYSISYTSGTTGIPKGVIITHRSMISSVISSLSVLSPTKNDKYFSYLPAAHMFEKVMSSAFYFSGARLGFYSGDIANIKEDISIFKPTFLITVPRVMKRFLDFMNGIILKEPQQKRNFIEKMIQEKIKAMKEKSTSRHLFYDFLYFFKFKQLFGGQLRLAMTGAAPLSSEVLDRFKVLLGVNVINAYGQTEATGAIACVASQDYQSGHAGGPGTNSDIKLVDIPEMGYTKDRIDEKGNLAPAGEICFRGLNTFPKYFKNQQATNEVLDELGWVHTGDVGLIRKNGSISVIDRKKNLVKLSQGEYVSPERVENANMNSQFLAFNFVYGNSFQDYLVAVVVPDRGKLEIESKRMGIEGEWEEICSHAEINDFLLKDLAENGKNLGLNGIEIVKKIYIHPYPITPESNLLTPTFKMKRRELKEYFLDHLEALYSDSR